MNLNEFAKEIHENSKAHGWWDTIRPFDELCALMISELSEALEEARAGRPMEWYSCPFDDDNCTEECFCHCGEHNRRPKPEGVAVEMADCAIRILDYLGSAEADIDEYVHAELEYALKHIEEPVGLADAFMHATKLIANAWVLCTCDEKWHHEKLMLALKEILLWFETNSLDFEAIARRKHEYNKTRAYKHGKEF